MKVRDGLSPQQRELFGFFVSNANKSGLHQMDWYHFYRFIIHSHRIRSRLSEADVKNLLVKASFSPEHSGHLAEVYRHGRAILQDRKSVV